MASSPTGSAASACLNGVSLILHVTDMTSFSEGLEESESVRAAPHGSSTPGSATRTACVERYEKPVPSVENRKVLEVGDSRRLSTSGSW